MKILNHKLDTATYQAARWIGEVIKPEIVVLHDTASRLTRGSATAYLRDNDAKVSVHFVIERDGSIMQQVPTNRRANHAGQSSFQGRAACNEFSIGIEIVNPGKMDLVRHAPLTGRAWFKEVYADGDTYDLAVMSTPEHGAGVWMDYTPAQIDAVTALLMCLFRDIGTLRDITTHWRISPGRKIDTNPLFPLESIRAKVLGRDDPADAAAAAGSVHAVEGELAQVETPGDSLNIRRWPSFELNIIGTIPDAAMVPVIRRGTFSGREWLLVQYGGREGWVVAALTSAIIYSE